MWDVYINFCTVIGFGLVTTAIGMTILLGALMAWTYLLDRSSGGA